MRLSEFIRQVAVSLACVGLLLPTSCMADRPVADANAVQDKSSDALARPRDIELTDGGALHGSVIDRNGKTRPNLSVYLLERDQLLATTHTNREGKFTIRGLRGGVYELAVGQQIQPVRCWMPNTAPPMATKSIDVGLDDVQRGQTHPSAVGLASPWVIAGIALAAIVIPIALHNNRTDRPAS